MLLYRYISISLNPINKPSSSVWFLISLCYAFLAREHVRDEQPRGGAEHCGLQTAVEHHARPRDGRGLSREGTVSLTTASAASRLRADCKCVFVTVTGGDCGAVV